MWRAWWRAFLLLHDQQHVKWCGRWSGMVALLRTLVGVSVVGGLLVVLLWSEHQVGVKTPAHIHFHAHARASPDNGGSGNLLTDVATRKPAAVHISNHTNINPASHNNNNNNNNNHLYSHHQQHTSTTNANTKTSNNASLKLVMSENHYETSPSSDSDTPIIYVITPTYRRPEQVAELTRLAQTLMLVPNLHWLVVEDAVSPTRRVLTFLDSCTVPHTYLLGTASRKYKGANKPRGVSNRNAGLQWLKGHAKDGVIYFADDDNTYDYRIFQEIRSTRQVSMFPVGLVTRLGVSSPIISNGKLIGFYDGWVAGRKFPVDMAGFAVNFRFYLQRNAPMMPYNVGFEEDGFLKALKINPEDIEPLADNCTKILVWHTRTVKSLPALKMPETERVTKTNLHHLKAQIVFQMPHGLS